MDIKQKLASISSKPSKIRGNKAHFRVKSLNDAKKAHQDQSLPINKAVTPAIELAKSSEVDPFSIFDRVNDTDKIRSPFYKSIGRYGRVDGQPTAIIVSGGASVPHMASKDV